MDGFTCEIILLQFLKKLVLSVERSLASMFGMPCSSQGTKEWECLSKRLKALKVVAPE